MLSFNSRFDFMFKQVRNNQDCTEVLVTVTSRGCGAPFNPCRLMLALKGWLTGLNVIKAGELPKIKGFRASAQLVHRVPGIPINGQRNIYLKEEFSRDTVTIRFESVAGK
jgi:hypothetical protein